MNPTGYRTASAAAFIGARTPWPCPCERVGSTRRPPPGPEQPASISWPRAKTPWSDGRVAWSCGLNAPGLARSGQARPLGLSPTAVPKAPRAKWCCVGARFSGATPARLTRRECGWLSASDSTILAAQLAFEATPDAWGRLSWSEHRKGDHQPHGQSDHGSGARECSRAGAVCGPAAPALSGRS